MHTIHVTQTSNIGFTNKTSFFCKNFFTRSTGFLRWWAASLEASPTSTSAPSSRWPRRAVWWRAVCSTPLSLNISKIITQPLLELRRTPLWPAQCPTTRNRAPLWCTQGWQLQRRHHLLKFCSIQQRWLRWQWQHRQRHSPRQRLKIQQQHQQQPQLSLTR